MAVDTFFLLGGYLAALSLGRSCERALKANPGSVCTALVFVLKAYAHRALRILPAFVFCFLLNMRAWQFLVDGPFTPPPSQLFIDQPFCPDHWFETLFFAMNAGKFTEYCMVAASIASLHSFHAHLCF